MSITTDTATKYFKLAALSAERGNIAEAIRYAERAVDLLLRAPQTVDESASAGTLKGETLRYGHLGKVLAAKAELAQGK